MFTGFHTELGDRVDVSMRVRRPCPKLNRWVDYYFFIGSRKLREDTVDDRQSLGPDWYFVQALYDPNVCIWQKKKTIESHEFLIFFFFSFASWIFLMTSWTGRWMEVKILCNDVFSRQSEKWGLDKSGTREAVMAIDVIAWQLLTLTWKKWKDTEERERGRESRLKPKRNTREGMEKSMELVMWYEDFLDCRKMECLFCFLQRHSDPYKKKKTNGRVEGRAAAHAHTPRSLWKQKTKPFFSFLCGVESEDQPTEEEWNVRQHTWVDQERKMFWKWHVYKHSGSQKLRMLHTYCTNKPSVYLPRQQCNSMCVAPFAPAMVANLPGLE